MRRPLSKAAYLPLVLLRAIHHRYNTRRRRLTQWFIIKFFTALPKKIPASLWHVTRRTTVLTRRFRRRRVRVYNGCLWRHLRLTPRHLGLRLGGFAKTKQIPVFRKKTLTKKAKPISAEQQFRNELRIAQVKELKLGQRRRHVTKYNPAAEGQFLHLE